VNNEIVGVIVAVSFDFWFRRVSTTSHDPPVSTLKRASRKPNMTHCIVVVCKNAPIVSACLASIERAVFESDVMPNKINIDGRCAVVILYDGAAFNDNPIANVLG